MDYGAVVACTASPVPRPSASPRLEARVSEDESEGKARPRVAPVSTPTRNCASTFKRSSMVSRDCSPQSTRSERSRFSDPCTSAARNAPMRHTV
eukprot:1823471-Prymnesium_polylepis.2